MAEEKRSQEAHDLMTRICDAMLAGAKAHPEYAEGMHCIAFISHDGLGGIGIEGYAGHSDDAEAIADLLFHLRAILRANGKDMQIVMMPGKIGHG